jgi:hypothetical protein
MATILNTQEQEIFIFSGMTRPTLGPTQPPNAGFFPGIKQSECEVDHSPLPSAKFENDGRYTSTPSMFLHNVTRTTFTSAFLLPYLTIYCFFFGRISTYADTSLLDTNRGYDMAKTLVTKEIWTSIFSGHISI